VTRLARRTVCEREGDVNRSQLLRRIDERWNALVTSCAGLSGTAMLEPGVIGTWSVKDIIAHVTSWEEEALTHLPVILAGGKPPRYSVTHGGIDAFNAKTAQRNRDLPLAEVLRRRDDMHRRLLAFIQGAPEDAFAEDTRVRRRLRLDTYGHYPIHAAAIRAWRARRPPA
jgi:hypothetical protein